MALTNFELIRSDLEKKGLLDLQDKFFDTCGRFTTLLYKEEIESLLRTDRYGGFSMLDLHDYPTQGTAIVGPLNAFWESKGFITPEAWRRFCSPTVPLLRMPKRTYTVDEPFEAAADVAHYGPAALSGVKPTWSIKDQQGREIATGVLPEQDISTGQLTTLGKISASLDKAEAPCKLSVAVTMGEFANDWDIWVYPPKTAPTPAPGVFVCEDWTKAKAALAEGKDVVFFAESANTAQSLRGRFLPVFWSPIWFPSQKPKTMGLLLDPKHPLFAKFPTESHTNWQWYDLMQKSRYFILDEMPTSYRPILQVVDNFERNHKLGIIFEGRVGKGRLLACGFNLPNQEKDPVARQLLAGIHSYVGSPAFQPKQEFTSEWLENSSAQKPRTNSSRSEAPSAPVANSNPTPQPM
jgi:hypothetical protein